MSSVPSIAVKPSTPPDTIHEEKPNSRLPQPASRANNTKRKHTDVESTPELRVPEKKMTLRNSPKPKFGLSAGPPKTKFALPGPPTNSLRRSKSSHTITRGVPNTAPSSRMAPINRTSARKPLSTVTSNRDSAYNFTAKAKSASNIAISDDAGAKSKRKPWDMKGRLEDLEKLTSNKAFENATLASQLQQLQQRTKTLEEEKENLSTQVHVEVTSNKEAEGQLAELRRERSVMEDELSSKNRQINEMRGKVRGLETQLASTEEDSASKDVLISTLEKKSTSLTTQLTTQTLQLEDLTKGLADARKLIEKQAEDNRTLNEKVIFGETSRRKLHNQVQELKGNIRVFCRMRPLLGEEVASCSDEIPHVNIMDERSLELTQQPDSKNANLRGGQTKYDFSFDRVFEPDTTQDMVFPEISMLVQSVLDGYNVCVFAYGQTGSGKTFTMEGVVGTENEGLIPRAVDQIFETSEELKSKGWSYKTSVSYLEIYNEQIRDLLVKDTGKEKYEIRHGKNNDTTVTNLKSVDVHNTARVYELVQLATKHRAVAATQCNEHSSRSHSVFQLKVTGENSKTTQSCEGTLSLVDLAGSERLKESKSEGARLTETKNINSSLSNLGNVIMALAQKSEHIPYRNSKLTHLLQNSLGGNSKTLMFVNISPLEKNFNETLSSLRFAAKVNQCTIGTATKKVASTDKK